MISKACARTILSFCAILTTVYSRPNNSVTYCRIIAQWPHEALKHFQAKQQSSSEMFLHAFPSRQQMLASSFLYVSRNVSEKFPLSVLLRDLYLKFLLAKFVYRYRFYLKRGTIDGHFTWRPTKVYDLFTRLVSITGKDGVLCEVRANVGEHSDFEYRPWWNVSLKCQGLRYNEFKCPHSRYIENDLLQIGCKYMEKYFSLCQNTQSWSGNSRN